MKKSIHQELIKNNKSSSKKIKLNQSTDQTLNPVFIKQSIKDNYKESINEIIALNSRLTKLFKSLNVSSNFIITFNNLPKTYTNSSDNPINLATEDYVLDQISIAELGDLTKTINFKNQELSLKTQGPLQLQDFILNSYDDSGEKYLNINLLLSESINDISNDNDYIFYFDDNYYLYHYNNDSQKWEIVNNIKYTIIKSNRQIFSYYNSKWNLINSQYIFLDNIINSNNKPEPELNQNKIMMFYTQNGDNYSYSLEISEKQDNTWEWIPYNKIVYCVILNGTSSFYIYTQLNNTWKWIKEDEDNYQMLSNIINNKSGNLKSNKGLFDQITIGNPDKSGEFYIYYKSSDTDPITKHNIVKLLQDIDTSIKDIKCTSIKVGKIVGQDFIPEILNARYEDNNPIVNITDLTVDGIIKINKNAGKSILNPVYVNLNNLLDQLQYFSEQLTFIKSINADDDSISDVSSYGNLRCESIKIPNILEISKENETDKYHVTLTDTIPELHINNILLPNDYYNLFTDESFITKKYFDGNQSTSITTPANIGNNDNPGILNLYGVPDNTNPKATIKLFYQTSQKLFDNTSNTTITMYGINSDIHDISNVTNTFTINNMAITKNNNNNKADILGINSIEMKEISLEDINNNSNNYMKIYYNNTDDDKLNFSFYDISTQNYKNLLQLKCFDNNIEINTDGKIIADKITTNNSIISYGDIITKTGFYIKDPTDSSISYASILKDNNISVLKIDKINTNNNGLIIEDRKNSSNNNEIIIKSFDSNIELYSKNYTENNISIYDSYIKMKDKSNKNNYIELNNYTYKDLSIDPPPDPDNRQEIPTLFIQNCQIQMNKTSEIGESIPVFYVDKTGLLKCHGLEIAEDINIRSITFKNTDNLFKMSTKETNNKSFIIYDISINSTDEVLKLEKTGSNLNTYSLKSYGFETFGTTNSEPNLKISNDGNLTTQSSITMNNGQFIMIDGASNILQIDSSNGINSTKNINLYSDSINGNNTISLTSSSGIISGNQFNTKNNYIQIQDNNTNTSIIKLLDKNNNSKYIEFNNNNNPTLLIQDGQIKMNKDGETNPVFSVNSDGQVNCKGITLNNNKIEIKDNHSINNTLYNIARLYDINYDPNSNPSNNNYIEFNNYSDDISVLSNPSKIPTLYIENGQIEMNNGTSDVFTVDKTGKITGNQIVLNNNGSSSLNNELNEDTQPKKYIKINNEYIKILDENNPNQLYININSDGIDSKSINIKDDNSDNKIYVGKHINDTDDDTNKLIKIMYDEDNKSYLEMYSVNGSDRKQKLLINDSNIETNNNIKIKNDNKDNDWILIDKNTGITIQGTDTDTNTIYKNIIDYDSLKIFSKTESQSDDEIQIKLSADGDITAKSLTINEISLSNIRLSIDGTQTYLQLTIGTTSYKIQLIPDS